MKYYVVDAFTDRVFGGNPAGVCILDTWLPDETMQNIAVENNLSETAFAVPEGEGYHLRWFTPGGEIDLCGHATLATGYVLMRFVEPRRQSVSFRTLGGALTVTKKGELYEMDFPSIPTEPYPLRQDMVEALGGVRPLEVYKGRDLIFLLEDEEAVKGLQPDFAAIKALPEGLAVFVTAPAPAGAAYDFVSRAFWPKLNVNEDPVCGSMHCSLLPYWVKKLGRTELVARQVSRRGGTLYLADHGARISMAGKAALYLTGEIEV